MPLVLACAAILLLTGCATTPIAVQAPALDLPPIPMKYRQPCEEPSPLLKGTIEEMYLQGLQDVGPWGRCVRDHDRVIALLEYQDSVVAKWKAQAAKPARAWWRFWE
jgi:hypothetical protein